MIRHCSAAERDPALHPPCAEIDSIRDRVKLPAQSFLMTVRTPKVCRLDRVLAVIVSNNLVYNLVVVTLDKARQH
jgi:hypothetical protein